MAVSLLTFKQIKDGNIKAFESLFRLYYEPLWSDLLTINRVAVMKIINSIILFAEAYRIIYQLCIAGEKG